MARTVVVEPAPVVVRDVFGVHTNRAVAFDGYGTLFNFANADFRIAVSTILAEQGIETDHDAFFRTWVSSYSRAGVWQMARGEGQGPDYDLVMNGPLPAWYSTWEIWRRQFGVAFEQHGVTGDGAAADNEIPLGPR